MFLRMGDGSGVWFGLGKKGGVHVPGDEMLLMGRPIMEEPETVAVPLPKCKVRSGRVALQGTSLGVGEGGLVGVLFFWFGGGWGPGKGGEGRGEMEGAHGPQIVN